MSQHYIGGSHIITIEDTLLLLLDPRIKKYLLGDNITIPL